MVNIADRRKNQTVYKENALIGGVCLSTGQRSRDNRWNDLEELEQLAQTAGAIIVDRFIQTQKHPTPNYYIGRGKVAEIKELAKRVDIDVVIFNNDLSPAQVRNLEKELEIKVIDRTELILDIFATHARTQQANLQVELAQLEYALPRLKGLWTHLSRIEGGIGQRGPGEQQIEVDRRLANKRINRLKSQINEINRRRQREVATRQDSFNIALVGYTNAGKSTLMNRLTGLNQLAEDKLFSTLDTKTHLWKLGSGTPVLLSDTVGFIRNLPHHLVSSFYATLEEARQSNLLLHIIDASSPEALLQVQTVRDVLKKLDIKQPAYLVLNKADCAEPMELAILKKQFPEALVISALTGQGIRQLEEKVGGLISQSQEEFVLKVPVEDGKLLAYLSAHGQVLKMTYQDSIVKVVVRLGQKDAYWVKKQLGKSCITRKGPGATRCKTL